MSNKRLALLCLSGERPTFTLATTSDNSLHIISVEAPAPDVAELKRMIESKLPLFADKGVTLFVDDPSGMLDKYGYKCSLSAQEYDGTGVLKRSLNRYFTLQRAGAITLPKNSHGFEIQPSIINERVKDNGEGYYQVDWPQLEDNARAALLLIHCAFSQNINQVSFAAEMYQALGDIESETVSEVSAFINKLQTANHREIRNPAVDELRKQGRTIL